MKVSVLVPIYNAEKYLVQCLDSLKAQTLEDIEFLCINDGSTDSSLSIIEEYVASDKRFRLIDKENSGYGASMNAGIDAAQGEYIGLVESDDFAESNMFEVYYQVAQENSCDLVKSNYYTHTEEADTFVEPFKGFPYGTVFAPVDMKSIIRVLPAIWSALYRREMLIEKGVRFTETPGASYQDTAFVFKAWVSSSRALVLPEGYLHYRIDNAASSVKSSSKVYALCEEYESSEAFIKKDPWLYDNYAPLLAAMKLNSYRWNFDRISDDCKIEFVQKWADELRTQVKEDSEVTRGYDAFDTKQMLEMLTDPVWFCEKYAQRGIGANLNWRPKEEAPVEQISFARRVKRRLLS